MRRDRGGEDHISMFESYYAAHCHQYLRRHSHGARSTEPLRPSACVPCDAKVEKGDRPYTMYLGFSFLNILQKIQIYFQGIRYISFFFPQYPNILSDTWSSFPFCSISVMLYKWDWQQNLHQCVELLFHLVIQVFKILLSCMIHAVLFCL